MRAQRIPHSRLILALEGQAVAGEHNNRGGIARRQLFKDARQPAADKLDYRKPRLCGASDWRLTTITTIHTGW
jgi:hypothetical protein